MIRARFDCNNNNNDVIEIKNNLKIFKLIKVFNKKVYVDDSNEYSFSQRFIFGINTVIIVMMLMYIIKDIKYQIGRFFLDIHH